MQSEYRLVWHRGKRAIAYADPERGRLRISLGTADEGLAEARARELWRARSAAPSDRVGDLWNSYIADRRIEIADVTRLEHAWKAIEPHFGHRLGSAITPADCRAYAKVRTREGRRASTIRTELEYLRACLNRRYGKGATHVWTPAASAPRDRYLTKEEADSLLAKIETPHVRLFVILAITTGARMGAILELTWDRIDFQHRTADFNPAGRHETDKRRVIVPLNNRAFTALEEARKAALSDYVIEWAGERVLSIKKAIRSAANRSGVQCSPHVFRHTAGVWMAQADVPMQKIAQYLGHTSTKVTERSYARYSPSFMRDASAALEF